MPLMMVIKRPREVSLSPTKVDVEKCPTCSELTTDDDDTMECFWCEGRTCIKISPEQCEVLSNIVNCVVFFCSRCMQRLPAALADFNTSSEIESRLTVIENKLVQLQSAEMNLSATMKGIESKLSEYHKSVSPVLSKKSTSSEKSDNSPMSEPVENISQSISQLSNNLDQCSTNYSTILSKFDKMNATSLPNGNVLSYLLTLMKRRKNLSEN